MSEENIELVRRAFDDVASQGNVDVLDEIALPGFVRHDLGGGRDIVGVEGIKKFIGAQRGMFAGLTLSIEDVVASGDKVVASYSALGRHERELMGIAPTGKDVTWNGVNIYRIEGGKLAETWQLADMLGVLRQLER